MVTRLCILIFYVKISSSATTLWPQIGWRGVTSVSGRYGCWLQPNWYATHVLMFNHDTFSYPGLMQYICGDPEVTPVQGSMTADYDQHFRRGWYSPGIKFQLSQWPSSHVQITWHVDNLFSANDLQTPWWLMWCHINCPEVKPWQVWLS